MTDLTTTDLRRIGPEDARARFDAGTWDDTQMKAWLQARTTDLSDERADEMIAFMRTQKVIGSIGDAVVSTSRPR